MGSTLQNVVSSKPERRSYRVAPETKLLLRRLSDRYSNSEQGVLEYAIRHYDPSVPVLLPTNPKEDTIIPQLAVKTVDLIAEISQKTGIAKSEVVRRAIHQLAERDR